MKLCQVRIRRAKICAKKGHYVPDLGMDLCGYHEKNEQALRAIGYDSRKDFEGFSLRQTLGIR